jgi:hypothetical protein
MIKRLYKWIHNHGQTLARAQVPACENHTVVLKSLNFASRSAT